MSERSGFNDLAVKIYERFSTTVVPDPAGDLQNITIESLETLYPAEGGGGGLFGAARFFIPRQVTDALLFKGGNRLVVENKGAIVYEGEITQVGHRVGDNAEQGIGIQAVGFWGALLGKRSWNKRWIDQRNSEDVWRWDVSATATATETITGDRRDGLGFTPQQGITYNSGDLAAFYYSMPTGELIRRVAVTRELQEKFLTAPSSVKHAVYDGYATPTKVWGFDGVSTYTDLTNAYDANTGTNVNYTLTTAGFIYVRYSKSFNKLNINLGATVNTNAATMTVQYFDGDNWQTAAGLSDGTASGGAMLAQDGIVSWTAPTAQDEVTVNGYRGFYVRISCSANLTAVNFVEIEVEDTEMYTYTDLASLYDGDTTTTSTLTIVTTDKLYIRIKSTDNLGLIRVDMGSTVNAVASVLSAEYYRAEYTADNVVYPAAWVALTIVDNTTVTGKTLAQDGDITFTKPGDMSEVSVDGDRGIWVRFTVSVNLTASIVINELYTGIVQAWELRLRDRANSADIWSVTSSGSTSNDTTLGTPVQTLHLEYISRAQQIGEGNGSVFARLGSGTDGLLIYSETGTISPNEIFKDIRAEVTELNSDETNISGYTSGIAQFVTEGQELISSILERAARANLTTAVYVAYLRESEAAASPNGKPVLFVQTVPDLTDHDYAIQIDEENVVPPFEVVADYDGIVNWVAFKYRDEESGIEVIYTPDDDSTFKDSDSITAYGEKHLPAPLDVGSVGFSSGSYQAQRLLQDKKDPKFYVSGPITVRGYIRAKNGNDIPASQIQAGKRIRIENFLDDKASVSGAGLTFLITQTSYDDTAETCSITTGVPDDLGLFLAQGKL